MDIRVERTYSMLVDAFEKLAKKKSFQEISVSEICELSTVRRATFYRHFEDKQDFFRYYLTTLADKFLATIAEGEKLDDLWEYTSYMHIAFAEYASAAGAAQRHLLGHEMTMDMHDMIVAQVADGITKRVEGYCEQQGITPPASPEFIGTFYAAGMVHMLRMWLFEDRPYTAAELERLTTDFLMRYLDAELAA